MFTKETVREKHRRKIQEILDQGGGIEGLVNYVMSRIGTVISYERRKNERQLMAQGSKNDENGSGPLSKNKPNGQDENNHISG